jgi:hypothetical protein
MELLTSGAPLNITANSTALGISADDAVNICRPCKQGQIAV